MNKDKCLHEIMDHNGAVGDYIRWVCRSCGEEIKIKDLLKLLRENESKTVTVAKESR